MTCNCEFSSVARTVQVGRVQRANPLPPGQYWIDVIGENAQAIFSGWRFENSQKILILVTENHEAIGGWPARDWVKFEVKEPVAWPAGIGFPEIIEEGQSVDSSEDTVTKPDPDDCEAFPDALDCQLKKHANSTMLVTALAAVASIAVVIAIRK